MIRNEKSPWLSIGTVFAIAPLLAGCQKNSYESCVEFQTEAGKRQHERLLKEPVGRFEGKHSRDLQYIIDNRVRAYCRVSD